LDLWCGYIIILWIVNYFSAYLTNWHWSYNGTSFPLHYR
jgi:hypothetical protein